MRVESTQAAQPAPVDPLEELFHGKLVRRHVREFGALFGVIFLGIAAYIMWTGGSLATAAALIVVAVAFAGVGIAAPNVLRPVWKAWMSFADVLGTVMTPVVLGIAWTLVVIPTALFLRAVGKKTMDLSCYEPGVETYWEDREEREHDFKLLERQF